MQKDKNGEVIKRPMTAYMLYNNSRRGPLSKEHQGKSRSAKIFDLGVPITELAKMVGQEWKLMDESSKQVPIFVD